MKMRFANCVLDVSARQLERQGKRVPLEPKVYELLELLIKRRPAVVSNNELDELLWPQIYVARTSLTRLVSKLRRAIGDSSRAPRVIRTAHKIGYAFCADVSGVGPGPATIEVIWRKRSLALADGEHFAGRDDTCTLHIDAGTVSRCHARLMVVSGSAVIEDLESTNGTRVNGTRISGPTRLRAGDEFSLGREVLRIGQHGGSARTIEVDPTLTVAAEVREN
jgi:DNA-binding winged helix-turn-helix (wHTH) protein